MERVVCQVDESRVAAEAVRAAIAYCQEHAAELELVGIVRESAFAAPQPAVGERKRRFKAVQHALAWASEVARSASLEPTVTIRAGNPEREILSEAESTGAVEAFLGCARSRLTAALTRRPEVEVTQLVRGATGFRPA
jgi:hypothetical protein